jgi:hypothetical protein
MQISILTVSSHVEPQNCIDSDSFYAYTLLFVLGFTEASENATNDTKQSKLRVDENMVES